jgi:hypothetical protein
VPRTPPRSAGDGETSGRASSPSPGTGKPEEVALRAEGAKEATWIRAKVVNQGGRPLPGATARADSGASTHAALDGTFVLRSTTPTTVSVSAPGYSDAHREVARAAGGVADLGSIELRGDSSFLVDVHDDARSPIAGAVVSWTTARSSSGVLNPRVNRLVEDSTWVVAGVSDDTGRLTARGAPSGSWLLLRAVCPDGRWTVFGPIESPASPEATVDILVGTSHTLIVSSRFRDGGPVGDVHITRTDGPPWARWTRVFPNPTGEIRIRLPAGRYRAGVLAAGRFLREDVVVLDTDRTLHLDFEALDGIRVRAIAEDGRAVSAFSVAAIPGEVPLPLVLGHALFRHESLVHAAREVAHVRVPAEIARAVDGTARMTLLVRAPGFGTGRTVIDWPPFDPDREVVVPLPSGLVVSGRCTGLEEGAEVRLYYLRDPGGAAWSADTAPLLDSARVSPTGGFVLRGLGAGDYEIRFAGPLMEIPLGQVAATGTGPVEFAGVYEPATLLLELGPGSSNSAGPVVSPVVPGNKWSPGDRPSATCLSGTRMGGMVVLGPIAPGKYAIRSSRRPDDVSAPGDTLLVDVRAGETRRVEWTPGDSARECRFTVQVPPGLPGDSVMVAAWPVERGAAFAAGMSWQPVGRDGRAVLGCPARGPFHLLVAVQDPTGGPGGAGGQVLPLRIATVPEVGNLEGTTISIPQPGSAIVRTSDRTGGMVEIRLQEQQGVLKDAIVARTDTRVEGLMAGGYQVSVTEAAADTNRPRRGQATFVVGPGESVDVLVNLE